MVPERRPILEGELGSRSAFYARTGEVGDQPLQTPHPPRGWSLNSSCPSPSRRKGQSADTELPCCHTWGPSQPPVGTSDCVTRWGTCHFAPAMLSEHPEGTRVSGLGLRSSVDKWAYFWRS